MKRRYMKLSWVCAHLVLLGACDTSSYQGGIEGSGVTTNPVAVTPSITTSGEVTALGSIVVNDVRYDLAGATIRIDGLPARESDLVPGQVTVVEGELAAGATHGIARRVTVETSVAGRISAVDPSLNQLTVLHQTIAIDAGTVVEDGVDGSPLRGLDIGRDVQVSGFVDSSGVIYATRVGLRRARTPLLVTGRVANLDTSTRTFSVNGQVVSYATAAVVDLASLAAGLPVRVAATSLNGVTLVAGEVSPRSEGLPGQPGAAAALQGLVTRFASANDFDVDGRRVQLSSSQRNTAVRLDAFVFVKGALTVGGVVAATEVKAVLPGRIVGGVTIEGVEYGLSGVMVEDGFFRLNIEAATGGPPSLDSGLGQLVGRFTFAGLNATGTGVLIGEGCALASAGRFCGTETAVRLEVTKAGTWIDQGSSGVIRVATASGETIWPLRLGYWGGRAGFDPSSSSSGGGPYELHQAEFVQASRVFLTGSGDGRLFFQSADTGCTGNLTISSYVNPSISLFNVEIEIRGCHGSFSYLNADFAGLMTKESLTPWGYDFSVLNMWLSTPAGAPSPAAITLWATPVE